MILQHPFDFFADLLLLPGEFHLPFQGILVRNVTEDLFDPLPLNRRDHRLALIAACNSLSRSCWPGSRQLSFQPSARGLPFPMNGSLGTAEEARDLRLG